MPTLDTKDALATPALSDLIHVQDVSDTTDSAEGTSKKVTLENVFGVALDVGARVYHDADQSINDNTTTALAFNSERYDTDAIHDTSTNNSRLTIPAGQGGKYLVTGHVLFAANATGSRSLFIGLNGISTFIAATTTGATSSGGILMSVATIYELAATDYVNLAVIQTSGGALDISASGNRSPEFAIQRIG